MLCVLFVSLVQEDIDDVQDLFLILSSNETFLHIYHETLHAFVRIEPIASLIDDSSPVANANRVSNLRSNRDERGSTLKNETRSNELHVRVAQFSLWIRDFLRSMIDESPIIDFLILDDAPIRFRICCESKTKRSLSNDLSETNFF